MIKLVVWNVLAISLCIWVVLGTSGCTTMGHVMRGMGDGLTNASNNSSQSKSTNCITTGSNGFYNTNCN